MAHHFMLPAALLSLLGAGLGIHLGNGAIDEINPAYFDPDEPPSRFYADLTPNPPRDWAAVQAKEIRAAEQGLALGSGCVGCRTYPVDYFPVHEATLGKPGIGWAAAEAPALEEDPVVAQPSPALAAVERYAHFPVDAEEAQEAEPADYAVIEEPGEYAAVEVAAAE